MHALVVLLPFLLLPLVAWVGGLGARRGGVLALVPAGLTVYLAWIRSVVEATGPLTVSLPWAPSLGLSLDFHFDGLGLFFALLITGIGTLVVAYAAAYLDGHAHAARFQVVLFAFMGSMLGVVLSDDVIALFVFWELTGFTSYFLIAFDHERSEARRAAMQALLVTGAGGLALLAAGVSIGQVTGETSLSVLRSGAGSLAGSPAYAVLVGLVLFAAFTKSAQFPFHFWLPNAMEAPTPASAYLHSATMVKAGIYLVARMTPLLGGTELWAGVIVTVGALTMLGGAYRSLLETDLKRILAYSTVSSLGVMMLLLGVGTSTAIGAALVYLAAHASYKGALFLVTGAVDHETGTRDVRSLAGLRRAMPRTAVAAGLAALSMAGVPPLFGFVAKESLYTSVQTLDTIPYASLLLGGAVVASAILGAAAFVVGFSPFAGARPSHAELHEPPGALWSTPLVLAAVGVVAGFAPWLVEGVLAPATRSVTGDATPLELALWHGFTPVLLLSVLTLALTLLLYRFRERLREVPPLPLGTEWLYSSTLAGVDALSRRLGPLLHTGPLRGYVRVTVLTAVLLLFVALAQSDALPEMRRWTPIRPVEAGVALLIIIAALSATLTRSTMAAVLSLGAIGYGIALQYALYGAPDLAATQFAVETLTVVIFVLVFYQLPGFYGKATWGGRTRDALIAGAAGATIALLVLVDSTSGSPSRLAPFFLDAAPRLAHGLNVVNVILVDFRAFDTMGEITVLVTVAVGVRALLQMGKGKA